VKTLKDSENVGKTGRVPRDIEHRSDSAPQKLSKRTAEENMAHILRMGRHHTIPIRWTMALLDFLGCREAIFHKLLEEDSDFQGAVIFQISLAWATVAPCEAYYIGI
jgi:hypothetical protein